MRLRRLFLPVLVAVALTACAVPRPGLLGPSDTERREYDAAIATARRDATQGRARLAAFLDRHPQSSLADDAVVPLARLERRAGRPQEAERRLVRVLRDHPKADRSDAARVELAKIVAERGETERAWRIARDVQLSLLRDAERADAYRLFADLAKARGDAAARLDWLARLRSAKQGTEAATAIDREIDEAIAALPIETLLRTGERLGRRAPAAAVWLRVADLALRAGDRDTGARAIGEAERLSLQDEQVQQLARLQAQLETPGATASGDAPPPLSSVATDAGASPASQASGAIGVVLPLSGPLAKVSEDVLRGTLLASGVFGSDPASTTGLRVVVRDTAGKPDRAAGAIRELGQRGDVVAVVGPLTKEEVDAAGPAAQEVGLPLLALTRHEGVARGSSEVVRFGLTRRMEAEVLAEHAVRTLGLTRMAILYPKDEYGREFESLLWQAVEARGGRVVAVSGYAPTATDFSKPIARLLGPQAERTAVTDPSITTPAPPPLVDFDALFIPDAHDKVALIALQLAANQVTGVRLLGPSGWHHPDLLRVAGTAVDGAFFSSGFDPTHPSSLIREFVDHYQDQFGSAPTPFAAQGFDAANLVGLQLARGAQSAADVRNGLVSTQLYPGVSGVTTIEASGDARKRPFLIEVRGGQLASLE